MGHESSGAGAVPMLFARWDPDCIPSLDLPYCFAPNLSKPGAGCHVQSLAEWMGVPGRTSTWLETDSYSAQSRRFFRFNDWILPDSSGKPIGRRAARGDRAVWRYSHDGNPDCFGNSVEEGATPGESCVADARIESRKPGNRFSKSVRRKDSKRFVPSGRT